MAAPLVAGEAALVRSVNRGATTAEVVRRLTQSTCRNDGQVRLRAAAAAAVEPSATSSHR
jgi:subtilisin family serine protease